MRVLDETKLRVIDSFNKYWVRAYYLPGTVSGTGGTKRNKWEGFPETVAIVFGELKQEQQLTAWGNPKKRDLS